MQTTKLAELTARYPGRHISGLQVLRYFDYAHLHDGPARDTSAAVAELALHMFGTLPDGPELTTGLRKLLEAKDCFVRASLDLQT